MICSQNTPAQLHEPQAGVPASGSTSNILGHSGPSLKPPAFYSLVQQFLLLETCVSMVFLKSIAWMASMQVVYFRK